MSIDRTRMRAAVTELRILMTSTTNSIPLLDGEGGEGKRSAARAGWGEAKPPTATPLRVVGPLREGEVREVCRLAETGPCHYFPRDHDAARERQDRT